MRYLFLPIALATVLALFAPIAHAGPTNDSPTVTAQDAAAPTVAPTLDELALDGPVAVVDAVAPIHAMPCALVEMRSPEVRLGERYALGDSRDGLDYLAVTNGARRGFASEAVPWRRC
jgi:hypothetical protein